MLGLTQIYHNPVNTGRWHAPDGKQITDQLRVMWWTHLMFQHALGLSAKPATDLRREDVVGHVPDSLGSIHIGVAHSFHFTEDGADCCVCGLVTFLVDEHPPGNGTESTPSCPVNTLWHS